LNLRDELRVNCNSDFALDTEAEGDDGWTMMQLNGDSGSLITMTVRSEPRGVQVPMTVIESTVPFLPSNYLLEWRKVECGEEKRV